MDKHVQVVVHADEVEKLLNILSAASLSWEFAPAMRNEAAALLGRLREGSSPDDLTDDEYDKYVTYADAAMKDGEIEMDMPTPAISRSDDGGAYLNCWYWVNGVEAGVLAEEEP